MPLTDKQQKVIEDKVRANLGIAVPDTEPEPVKEKTQNELDLEASEVASDRAGINKPGFRELVAHMERFGPDGIIESAIHLGDEQKEKLAARVKKMKYNKEKRKWE